MSEIDSARPLVGLLDLEEWDANRGVRTRVKRSLRPHVRRLGSFPSRVISWVCLSGNVCATSQGVVRFLDPDGSIPTDKIA